MFWESQNGFEEERLAGCPSVRERTECLTDLGCILTRLFTHLMHMLKLEKKMHEVNLKWWFPGTEIFNFKYILFLKVSLSVKIKFKHGLIFASKYKAFCF